MSFIISDINCSTKSVVDIRKTCMAPTLAPNHLRMFLLIQPAILIFSYRSSWWTYLWNFSLMLCWFMVALNSAWHTLSKTFFKSIRPSWRSHWWCKGFVPLCILLWCPLPMASVFEISSNMNCTEDLVLFKVFFPGLCFVQRLCPSCGIASLPHYFSDKC